MTTLTGTAIAVALLGSVSCTADKAKGPLTTRNDARVAEGDMLRVELRVSPARVVEIDDLSIVARVYNGGASALEIDTLALSYPSIVLQIRNAAGVRVALGPPPVPSSQHASTRRVLEPGQELTFEYGSPFGSRPAPGGYEVRLVATSLESSWVPFEIVAP